MSPAPRLTRRELRELIRGGQWQRLRQRLDAVPSEDVTAQLPALSAQEQALLQAILTSGNSASAASSTTLD